MRGVDLTGIYRRCSFKICDHVSESNQNNGKQIQHKLFDVGGHKTQPPGQQAGMKRV